MGTTILYITEVYPDQARGLGVWGGGEKQFYEISRRVSRKGYTVKVLTCRFPGQPSYERTGDIEIFHVGLSRDPKTGGPPKSPLAVADYLLRTTQKVVEIRPNLVHCNAFFPVLAARGTSTITGTPMVATFHDVWGLTRSSEYFGSSFWGLAGYGAMALSTRFARGEIIAVSKQCESKLRSLGVDGSRITLIPNGVDLGIFDSVAAERNEKQVLYVGRLVRSKRVDVLLTAFGSVLRSEPRATLVIVGDGPERTRLGELASSLGIQAHVRFTGTVAAYEEVAKHFRESAVFVLPSGVEGEGIVLKEAMAARLPVIGIAEAGSGVLGVIRTEGTAISSNTGTSHKYPRRSSGSLPRRRRGSGWAGTEGRWWMGWIGR